VSEPVQSRPSSEPIADRPEMPGAYGISATTSGLIRWEEVRERLASARSYWIGTTRPDGRPHAAPVWGLWLDEAFYFSTDPTSRKARNFARNPAIVVHLESGDDVVMLEGTVEAVADAAVAARFADAYEAKYQFRPEAGDPPSGIYRLRASVAFAWLERDFPQSATRFRF
jgi:PPOX class probable F420-dependent enzyme